MPTADSDSQPDAYLRKSEKWFESRANPSANPSVTGSQTGVSLSHELTLVLTLAGLRLKQLIH